MVSLPDISTMNHYKSTIHQPEIDIWFRSENHQSSYAQLQPSSTPIPDSRLPKNTKAQDPSLHGCGAEKGTPAMRHLQETPRRSCRDFLMPKTLGVSWMIKRTVGSNLESESQVESHCEKKHKLV